VDFYQFGGHHHLSRYADYSLFTTPFAPKHYQQHELGVSLCADFLGYLRGGVPVSQAILHVSVGFYYFIAVYTQYQQKHRLEPLSY
jgi:hypothetical protein